MSEVNTTMRVITRCAQDTDWCLYQNPEQIIEVFSSKDLSPALDAIEAQAAAGFTCLGFVQYEKASSQQATPTPFGKTAPRLSFGVFTEGTQYTPQLSATEGFLSEGNPIAFRDYADQFSRVKSALAAGDVYQINLTHELTGEYWGDPLSIFFKLYEAQPTRHAIYIEHGDLTVMSMTPETFLTRQGNTVQMIPMKGTRARGATPALDEAARMDLETSAKDRAENLMIVDMVRNDLGQISSPGSVTTDQLFRISPYPTVWQMTSTISGKTEATLAAIFRATFPCASITGAPKTAAMDLIARLERRDRGIYTGAIGRIGPGQDIDLGVAIRTLQIDTTQQRWRYGVGSGVVWDSQLEDEWAETLDKAELLKAAQDFQLIETCRFEPGTGIQRFALHLERLARSAKALAFNLDHDLLANQLNDIRVDEPSRVRVLVSRRGQIEISYTPIPEAMEVVRLSLAKAPLDSFTLFTRHKTTHRQCYESAEPVVSGADDILLFNERGELMETRIFNIFLVIDGTCWTPALSSGCLPGVYREQLLRAGAAQERVLMIEHLKVASKIFVTNSLRGQLPAMLLTKD